MSEVVETDPWDIGGVDQPSERFGGHVGMPRPTVAHGEHEVAVVLPAGAHEELVLDLADLAATQHGDRVRIEIQASPALLRFRVSLDRLVTDRRASVPNR